MTSEQEVRGGGDAPTDRESVRTDRDTDRQLDEETSRRSKKDVERITDEDKRKRDRMLKRDCYGLSKNSLCCQAWLKETQHFTNTTTMHGPKRIFNGRNLATQMIWAFIFICALTGLTIQIAFIMKGYIENPPIGQIAFHLSSDGMTFPAVTLCNLNPIKMSEIKQLNISGDLSHDVLEYLLQTNMDATFHYSNLDRLKLAEVHEKAKAFMNNHTEFNIDNFLKTAGHDCEETFPLCYFGGEQFDCCKYMEPVVTSIGKCYTLDLANRAPVWMQRQKSPGSDTGLQIIADANLQEEMNVNVSSENTMYFEIFEHGFRYFVHQPGAHPELSSEGVSVGPAKVAYTAIKKSTQQLLESDCVSSYPPGLSTNLTFYSAPACRYTCLAQHFSQLCNCTPFTFNIDASRNICLTWESADCMDKHMTENGTHLKFPECEKCLFECESTSYTTSNSYGIAFNKGSLGWLSNRLNKTKEHIQESVSVINIYFSEMFHTAYTQESTTNVHQMLSDIGGNMGMFAGMSMITIFEILLYFCKSFALSCCSVLKNGLYKKKIYDEDQEDYLEEETKKYQMRKNQHPLRSAEPPLPRNEAIVDEPVDPPPNRLQGPEDVENAQGEVTPRAEQHNESNREPGIQNQVQQRGNVGRENGEIHSQQLTGSSKGIRPIPRRNANENANLSQHSTTRSTTSHVERRPSQRATPSPSPGPSKRQSSRRKPLDSQSEQNSKSLAEVRNSTPGSRSKKSLARQKSSRG